MSTKLKGPFGEEIQILNKLSKTHLNIPNATYFVDNVFKKRIRFASASRVIYLKAGENLKTFKNLEKLTDKLLKLGHQKSDPIVVIGGGSLGDSIGFLASVYLRGVPFYQIPTTWLSVIDSAVGGKTALNFKKYKNQIGSFYAPEKILISKELLKTSKIIDARGEILKTLALNLNKTWAKNLLKDSQTLEKSKTSIEDFVKYKAKVVKQDIKDQKGVRAVLNLGHSLAHAFELEFNLSHSSAVELGLKFSINWSKKLKLLNSKNFHLLYHNISSLNCAQKFTSKAKLKSYLSKDKKVKGSKINFIFLNNNGPVLRKTSLDTLIDEYFRQIKENEL